VAEGSIRLLRASPQGDEKVIEPVSAVPVAPASLPASFFKSDPRAGKDAGATLKPARIVGGAEGQVSLQQAWGTMPSGFAPYLDGPSLHPDD